MQQGRVMHTISIPQHIKERIRAVRGSDHVFKSLDPARVAHLCVDMQNGFCEPGAPIEVPMTREIFGQINTISAAVRAAGGSNFFSRYTRDPAEPIDWSIWFDNYLSQAQLDQQAEFRRGQHAWEVAPEITVKEGDVVFDKTRFSCLIPGTSPLGAELEARGVDTLIITGTLTNCCCESTARDALQMGYKVIFVSDANATLSDEEHNATLISMYTIFADVMTTAELTALLGVEPEAEHAAA